MSGTSRLRRLQPSGVMSPDGERRSRQVRFVEPAVATGRGQEPAVWRQVAAAGFEVAPEQRGEWRWVRSLLNWKLFAVLFWHVPVVWTVLLVSCYLAPAVNPLRAYLASFAEPASYGWTALVYASHLLLGLLRFRLAATGSDVNAAWKRRLLLLVVGQVAAALASVFAVRRLLRAGPTPTLTGHSDDDSNNTAALYVDESVLRSVYLATWVGVAAACRYALWDERIELTFPRLAQPRLARFRGRLASSFGSALATAVVSLGVFYTLGFYLGALLNDYVLTALGWFVESPVLLRGHAEDLFDHVRLVQSVLLTLLLWELNFHVLDIVLTDPLQFSVRHPPAARLPLRPSQVQQQQQLSSLNERDGATTEPALSDEHVEALAEFVRGVDNAATSEAHLLSALACPHSSYVRHLAALDLHRVAFFDQYRRGVFVFDDSKLGPWLALLTGFCQRSGQLVEQLRALTERHRKQRAAATRQLTAVQQLRRWFGQLVRDNLVPFFQPVAIASDASAQQRHDDKGERVDFPWPFGRQLRALLREQTLERQLLGDWQAMVWLVEALGQLVVVSVAEDEYGIVQNTNSLAILLNALAALHGAVEGFLRSAPPPMLGGDPRLASHQFVRLRPYVLIDSLNRTISTLITTFEPHLAQVQPYLTPSAFLLIDKLFK